MKRVLLAAYAAFFLTFAMIFIQCRTTAAPEKNEYMHPANEPAATAGVWTFTPEPITTPELAAALAPYPAPETVTVKNGDEVQEMDMQSYLVGVVAAEMPASLDCTLVRPCAAA